MLIQNTFICKSYVHSSDVVHIYLSLDSCEHFNMLVLKLKILNSSYRQNPFSQKRLDLRRMYSLVWQMVIYEK